MLPKISRYVLVIAFFLVLVPETGCVRRRLMLRSNPPGAMAYVNHQPVGQTPISVPFTYYGTMDFRLVMDGHETVSEKRQIRAPWYQWPGVDFFSEVVWPQRITDERTVTFDLRPERVVPQDELIARAEAARRDSQSQGSFRSSNGIISTPSDVSSPNHPVSAFLGESGLGSIGAPSSQFGNPLPGTSTPIQQPPTIPNPVSPTVPGTGTYSPYSDTNRYPIIPNENY